MRPDIQGAIQAGSYYLAVSVRSRAYSLSVFASAACAFPIVAVHAKSYAVRRGTVPTGTWSEDTHACVSETGAGPDEKHQIKMIMNIWFW